MDPKTQENEHRWDELARNGVLCSQPKLNLDAESARAYLNKHGFYSEELKGKEVLCLASGGGQQSVGFALLGAKVTVVDFSEEQLMKDREAAATYRLDIQLIKSDMRNLSMLPKASFDIVYQPYSINYIPSVTEVFDQVSRVIKPGGLYDLMFHNPFVHGSWKHGCWEGEWPQNELWNGIGYPLWQPYQDGSPIETVDPHWRFSNHQNQRVTIKSPQEYRHTLSTIINGLITRHFQIKTLKEESRPPNGHPPGSWAHYQSIAPPWLYLLTQKT